MTIHRQYRPDAAAVHALVDLLDELLLAEDAAMQPTQPTEKWGTRQVSPAEKEAEVLPSAA